MDTACPVQRWLQWTYLKESLGDLCSGLTPDILSTRKVTKALEKEMTSQGTVPSFYTLEQH